ncbi:hypothetical protein [Rhodopseudomonas pseudopalustris]|uniref:hypothetical protein n=1 Tax=Rhodopseudomonas pseudopalustris TaxID=1513892 RepID=UPI000B83122E|nr:hypothetical protein [Rhodopseudomonas pseudopalustris]
MAVTSLMRELACGQIEEDGGQVVERVSHRVASCISEIVKIGSREAVSENPTHPYTKRLLAVALIRGSASLRRSSRQAEIKSPCARRPTTCFSATTE